MHTLDRILASLLLLQTAGAADAIKSTTTHAQAYGTTQNAVVVDPATDLPPYPAVEPSAAISTWQVKKGFHLELAAHEPQVCDPIAVSFDARGRMFACEMIDYSERRDESPHPGRVSMLVDQDGDGHYETSTVFADDLAWPTGLICANGGVFVIATPDILFLKDTNGDGRADHREVVFTGFGTGLKLLNVQGLANCPQWGLDHRIHIQCGGGNRGKVKCLTRPDLPEIEIGGRDFWFDPRTFAFGLEAGGAQYGMSFDDYGRKFACSNSDHLQFFVCDDRYAARNPHFDFPNVRQSVAVDGGAAEVFRISPDEPWRIIRTRWRIAGVVKGVVEGGGRVSGYFTGATGTTVYRGDAYGPEFANNTFTGDAGGQLVHRKIIVPDGTSVKGMRPADEQGFEFAASSDTWVRIVNFANAPDGCLHFCDMYREIIEHPWSIPDEIKQHLDLNAGNHRGRIYRVVPDRANWQRRTTVDLDSATTSELVATLTHPNGWHRDTATRLLYQRNDPAAVPLLEMSFAESPDALGRLHALCALTGFGAVNESLLLKALVDADEHVRERAILLAAEQTTNGIPSRPIREALENLARDPSARVQLQLALTLGDLNDDSPVDPFSATAKKSVLPPAAIALHMLKQQPDDAFLRAAVLSAPPHRALWTLEHLLLVREEPLLTSLGPDLIRITAAHGDPTGHRFLVSLLSSQKQSSAHRAEWLTAFTEGLKSCGTTLAEVDPDHKLPPLFAEAAALAADPSAPSEQRLDAITLLRFSPSDQAQSAITTCLAADQPDALQLAAVQALAGFQNDAAAPLLLPHWPDLKPSAQQAAITVLLAHPKRTRPLLTAIESGKIPATALSAAQIQALATHKDPAIASLAKSALAAVIPLSTAERLAQYQDAIATPGDAARGRTHYLQRCAACHRAGAEGLAVGPDLITVKTKGRDALFTAILEPSKEVAAQYLQYTITTKEGATFAGCITADTATTTTLTMAAGITQTIPRTNIQSTTSDGKSLMPEGLETGLSVQDLADLLTFIETLP